MLTRYLPIALLPISLIRPLILGATGSDAVIIASLALLYGLCYFLDSKKEPVVNNDLKVRLMTLEAQMSETKATVTAFKLGSQMRGANVR